MIHNKEEIALNCKLSLALLMPEAQVIRLCIESKEKRRIAFGLKFKLIDEVQKKFNVSKDLAVARLTGLGLI